jgi:hypothetical protein
MDFEIIKSRTGKDMIVFDGCSFIFGRLGSLGKKLWRCSKNRSIKCLSRVHTLEDKVIIMDLRLKHLTQSYSSNILPVKSQH